MFPKRFFKLTLYLCIIYTIILVRTCGGFETGCLPGGRGDTLLDKPGDEDGVMVRDLCTGGEAVTVILAGGELAIVTNLECAGVM